MKASKIICKISGTPYCKSKRRGKIGAKNLWTEMVVRKTRGLPKIKGACTLKIHFFLPPDKFPTDLPHGPDIDNLLKRFLDALNETIFKNVQGHDSCVVSLSAKKIKVKEQSKAGVVLEIKRKE